MTSSSSLRLGLLRREFDSSFQRAPEAVREQDSLLVILVGARAFALDLAQISGIVKLEAWTPLITYSEYVLGVTSIRGDLVTIFDLGRVFGAPGDPAKMRRIVTVTFGEHIVGLGFAEVREHLRIERSATEAPDKGMISRTIQVNGESIGLIDVQAVLKNICGEQGETHV